MFWAPISGGESSDYMMHQEARKAGRHDEQGKLVYRPEERAMENARIGVASYTKRFI